MALFQKSVQNDYLNRVQDSSIKEYWEYYDSYFNNPEKQKLIEGVSERKFYSEFISKLFGKCLGSIIQQGFILPEGLMSRPCET